MYIYSLYKILNQTQPEYKKKKLSPYFFKCSQIVDHEWRKMNLVESKIKNIESMNLHIHRMLFFFFE